MTPSRKIRSLSRARAFLLAGMALPLLAACNVVDKDLLVGGIPEDYRTRHPIVISDGLTTMDLPVSRDQAVIAEPERAAIAGFARGFNNSGARLVAILIPSGSANQAAATAFAAQVRQVLQASGISRSAIDTRSYAVAPNQPNAALRLAYSQIVARTDACGQWPDQTAQTLQNRNYENFGCATQQNLAAMVVSPLDLMYPREMTAPDAERRGEMLKNYRSGSAPTQSTSARDGNGYVATVPAQ